MADTPIVEQEWLGGLKVVDIGDLRIARGLARRPVTSCSHLRLVYDRNERRVWCKDCETNVEAFDAFEMIASRAHTHVKDLNDWQKRLEEIEKFKARSLAAQQLEKAWRSKTMVPICPCCKNGLFADDFKNGSAAIDKEFAIARRRTP